MQGQTMTSKSERVAKEMQQQCEQDLSFYFGSALLLLTVWGLVCWVVVNSPGAGS